MDLGGWKRIEGGKPYGKRLYENYWGKEVLVDNCAIRSGNSQSTGVS